MAAEHPAPTDASRNRDDQMKPGAPPRSVTEPAGSRGSSDSPKTHTDPATGAPHDAPPEPAGSGR